MMSFIQDSLRVPALPALKIIAQTRVGAKIRGQILRMPRFKKTHLLPAMGVHPVIAKEAGEGKPYSSCQAIRLRPPQGPQNAESGREPERMPRA